MLPAKYRGRMAMNRSKLPNIRMDAKPSGLKFKPPATAIARFDRQISLAAAAAPAENEIEILGEIGDSGWSDNFTTAKMVKDKLKSFGKSPVRVTVNSPGGDAFEGIAIYNLLREHPGAVTVDVLGMAASAASIIAMAGDQIRMGEAAFLMIHSAWGFVAGNQKDMRDLAEILDSIDQAVSQLYATRSGMKKDEVLALMQKETWMTAEQAMGCGMADCLMPDAAEHAQASQITVVKLENPKLNVQELAARLAASGNGSRVVVRLDMNRPGATGLIAVPIESQRMKTISQQIQALEAKRAASVARREAIQNKAIEEGRTKDTAEKQEFDTLSAEIVTVDSELVDLKLMEAQQVATATVVTAATGASATAAAAARGGEGVRNDGSGIVSVSANVEKGIAFARYVKALAMSRGNLTGALAIAQNNKNWMDTTPQVAKVLMAAVAGGDTTTAGWASELVYAQNLADEFINILRPLTIIGRIPNLTRVPFNVRVSGADQGTSAFWIGQGKPVPVSKMHTLAVTLGIAKAAGLVVMTEELIRSSSPSAEIMVRNDLMKAIVQFLDQQFVDPSFAAVANVSPASITSGVNPTPATGTTAATLRTDVQTMFNAWIVQNLDPTGGVWIMTPTTALAISLMLNALGQPVFPDMSMTGGEFFGLPVVVSQSALIAGSPSAGEGNMIILLNAPEILLADDGQVTVDASREASLEMLDNPTNSAAAGTPTTMVSMFQTNAVAIKAVRFINWQKRRTFAVQYIKDAAYVT
jgi:HK97 family phage major capsid protein